MTLRITSVANAQDPSKQRVVIRPKDDDDLGHYAVLLAQKAPDDKAFGGTMKAAFWFPDRKVTPKDVIVLYTKQGTNSEKNNDDGGKSYFYYLGIGEVDFNNYAPVLLSSPSYQIYTGL